MCVFHINTESAYIHTRLCVSYTHTPYMSAGIDRIYAHWRYVSIGAFCGAEHTRSMYLRAR